MGWDTDYICYSSAAGRWPCVSSVPEKLERVASRYILVRLPAGYPVEIFGHERYLDNEVEWHLSSYLLDSWSSSLPEISFPKRVYTHLPHNSEFAIINILVPRSVQS